MHRVALTLAVATAIVTAGGAGSGAALASSHPDINNNTYYLSLGDSLAQGVQPNSQGVSVETNQGYANQLNTALRQTNPYLRLVKLGCPGETTATMINGGICSYAQGSQLAQAVAFLKKHASQTQLVTIDIGANDLNRCVAFTKPTRIIKCLEKVIPRTVTHLGHIMAALRAADPGTIIGMAYYVPELADWLKGTTAAQQLAEASAVLAKAFNQDLGQVYKQFGAPVANVYAAFRSGDFTDMVTTPQFGTIPLNVALLCSYTWQCAPPPVGPNEHANVLGYGVIAKTFLKTYFASAKAG
jgi:lysophospholipase L1-like esterase